ncbi:HAMP domain-containing histidine kinase [Jatrophihabitans telluris]|uniref:histidine kinase n=1 Tax=Jatrophihabitans telluris TaxID=2038343 RepID=A0ABY4QTF9_9ACTN|nr:HAMP domain-containing sensor histidine kinase [Jatrophihabitans telluris]UQX87011.1 HAMP domain-containing histidine kinase [Jatrophihabitans telluris]
MRRRIVSLTVLSSLLCILLFAVPLALGASYYFRARERSDLQRIAYAVASAAADNVTSGARLAQLERPIGGVRVGLYGPDGRFISGVNEPRGAAAVRGALAGTAQQNTVGDEIVISVPVIDQDTVTGAVLATRSVSATRWQIGLSWVALVVLAALGLAAAGILARRQASRLARPLEQLSLAAERVGEGDFTAQAVPVGIAEIDSVNQSMERAAARLRMLLARERALAGDASHQLRTPLTGLRLVLERAAATPHDNAAAIAEAQHIIERLELTVTDMLHLVRGAPRPDEPLSIPDLVAHVEQRWQSTFAGPGRTLSVRVEGDLPPAFLRPDAARQILNVLIDNAGVHGQGTASVVVRDALGSLAIDVSQDGPPLTVAAQSLFAERVGAGSRIGLPLARAIAETAAARLIVTATDPPTFTLLIPPRPDGAPVPSAPVVGATG